MDNQTGQSSVSVETTSKGEATVTVKCYAFPVVIDDRKPDGSVVTLRQAEDASAMRARMEQLADMAADTKLRVEARIEEHGGKVAGSEGNSRLKAWRAKLDAQAASAGRPQG